MTHHAVIPGATPGRADTASLADRLGGILSGPDMDGATCKGHAADMEPATRWDAALAIVRYCEQCPVIGDCAQLERSQRYHGGVIWAGRYVVENPSYRPRAWRPLPLGKARAYVAGLIGDEDITDEDKRRIG